MVPFMIAFYNPLTKFFPYNRNFETVWFSAVISKVEELLPHMYIEILH